MAESSVLDANGLKLWWYISKIGTFKLCFEITYDRGIGLLSRRVNAMARCAIRGGDKLAVDDIGEGGEVKLGGAVGMAICASC